MPTRILIADDHGLVAEALASLLASHADLAVVGRAADGREAVRLALELVPDVVVMDLSMPEMNGVDATRAIVGRLPGTRVIVLSMYSSPEFVHRAMAAGAHGYLLKRAAGRELFDAICAVRAGRHFFSESITEIVVERYLDRDAPNDPLEALSVRERQVLQLLAESHSTAGIAATLGLSPKTIETYRARLFTKLDLKDLAGLVRFAIRHGITPLD